MPADDGIVRKFLRWMLENDIHEAYIGAGHSGAGSYLGFFEENSGVEVVPRIRAWLVENGVVEDDEATWERRQ